jgi:hypothetical protein
MSDGGTGGAGWQPDPDGRHEYRYWDGTAWTDQVSDGGMVSTDPPGPAPTAAVPPVTPSPADTTTSIPTAAPPGGVYAPGDPYATGMPGAVPPQKSKVPVGLLALIGLVVAAIVAAVVIFALGGDDGGGDGNDVAATSDDASDSASSDDTSDELSDDSDVLTNDFSDDTSDFTDDFSDEFSDDFTDSTDDTTGQVGANNLRVGDCVEDQASVTAGQVIDCASPHVFEVYGRFDVAGGAAFPGDAALQQEGQRCVANLFEDYVGVPYANSEIYATPLLPTSETWAVGDRTVICLAHTQDQSPTTGSVEGANR